MPPTNKAGYCTRLTVMEACLHLSRQIGVALLVGVLTTTASFSQEMEQSGKAGGAVTADDPAKAGGEREQPSAPPHSRGTVTVVPFGASTREDRQHSSAPASGADTRTANPETGRIGDPPPAEERSPADKGTPSRGLHGSTTPAPSSADERQGGNNTVVPGSKAAPAYEASRTGEAGGDGQTAPASGKANAGSAGDAIARSNSQSATGKGASPNSRSGGPRESGSGAPTSSRQDRSGKPASSRSQQINATPIDLNGGLPRSKDASKELHQKVQEIAKRVSELGKRIANSARAPAQIQNRTEVGATATTAGVATRNIGHLNMAGRPMAAGQQISGTRAAPRGVTTSSPSDLTAKNRLATHGLISGTGTIRAGTGPGTIGGAAKSVVGVDGSTVRPGR